MTGPLRTDRLVLRRWRPADLEPFAALNADQEVMEHFPSTLDRSASDALAAAADAAFDRYGFGLWAVEVASTGAFIGRSQAVMRRLGMTHDPAENFDHPGIPTGHRLRRHVPYRIEPTGWRARR
ncbi:MAG TPA: GNAT family N-acetyltransferase [Acidimicrobiales bacterium]|nr:GNAT family N-acetyltransferase [Acidimicrobiales bacterium]